MRRTLVFLAMVIITAGAVFISSCGATKNNSPVMTPAVEASIPAPAKEATNPIETSAPEEVQSTEKPAESSVSVETTEQTAKEKVPAIKLYLNGNKLILKTAPILENGVVMVPVAEICGAFSREITSEQNGDTLTLIDADRGNTIELTAGSTEAKINGTTAALDAAPLLAEDGALLMPLTAFRTLFDADNKYIEEYNSAYIVESGLC